MNKIKLTEETLNRLIAESINEVIKEEGLEEGMFDRIGSTFKGAKMGYQQQAMLDRGVDGYKMDHDREDYERAIEQAPFKTSREAMGNTAEEEARETYMLYKKYQAEANKLLNRYNQLVKEYGLSKETIGRFVNPNPQSQVPQGAVNVAAGKNKFNSKVAGRDRTNDTRSIGLWNK